MLMSSTAAHSASDESEASDLLRDRSSFAGAEGGAAVGGNEGEGVALGDRKTQLRGSPRGMRASKSGGTAPE